MVQTYRRPLSQTIQFLTGFVVPTVILLTLSDESKLGPLLAMGLALLPPVVLELYSLVTGRKASVISFVAIVGILLIGVISLFGLSEEWLGVRRAAIYLVGAIALAGLLLTRRDVVDKGLEKLIDMDAIGKVARKKKIERQLAQQVTRVAWLFAGLLLAMAIWSYILTIIVITAPAGSSEFNAEYAELRVLGIPLVTLPFVVGTTVLLMYLVGRFEKLTGIEVEKLLKKKR